MTGRARTFLREIYGVPEAKIDLIAHGIPDTPFVEPDLYKQQFGVEGRPVALTFGLLSPNKGIEHMLRAMPGILEEFPDLVYIVLGATHPDLVREQGEQYRLGLERLARGLGIDEERHLLQPVRGAGPADRVHPGGRHLRDPYLNPRRSPRAPWPTPSAAARRSSRRPIGMPRNCWPTDWGCWCRSPTLRHWRGR